MKKIFTYTMMALMAMTMFTSCDTDDQYIASQLRNGDWQGYINTYYQDRWGLNGNEFATVMQFYSRDDYYTSGRGMEVDYNTRSAYRDYAYCTFKWFIVDGEITLIYDDSKWQPIYIVDYTLTSSYFRGYIYNGTNSRIWFDLESTTYDGWNNYKRGSYGDFSNQNYYWSRTTRMLGIDPKKAEADVPLLDRTTVARQESGEADAVSVASGEFAKAIRNY